MFVAALSRSLWYVKSPPLPWEPLGFLCMFLQSSLDTMLIWKSVEDSIGVHIFCTNLESYPDSLYTYIFRISTPIMFKNKHKNATRHELRCFCNLTLVAVLILKSVTELIGVQVFCTNLQSSPIPCAITDSVSKPLLEKINTYGSHNELRDPDQACLTLTLLVLMAW